MSETVEKSENEKDPVPLENGSKKNDLNGDLIDDEKMVNAKKSKKKKTKKPTSE